MKKNNHCCELMVKFTNDPRIGISYISEFRKYYIDLLGGGAIQTIFCCPFCCSRLPQGLRDEYFNILEKEYNVDDPYDEEQLKRLPEEFKSDAWWKKRKIKAKKTNPPKKSKSQKTKHCCEDMDSFLEEKKVGIFYNPIYRDYFILMNSYPNGKQVIYGCPWCGYNFPRSLIEKREEVLEKEYKAHYDSHLDKFLKITEHLSYPKEATNVPEEEFKSDEWWKKRGL